MPTAQHKQIIVGMSGGVDSSVSALLLQKQGHQVSGLFMKNWEDSDPDSPCQAAIDVEDAFAVCEKLNISLDAVNFAKEYWDHVFEYFLDEYRRGRTPNPDVLCNKEIKFRAFLDYAIQQGADCIATGHYARVAKKDGRYQLLKGQDENKDQSYFLYLLNQQQLAKTVFPLGEISKPKVRQIATDAGFANHEKKDSTGICFIGEQRFKTFLNKYLPACKGEIHSIDNELLGTHDGLMFHTIGQRKGLGIGGRQNDNGEPWYVVGKDLSQNILIVAQGHNHPTLFSSDLIAGQIHWISGHPPEQLLQSSFACHARIRYRQEDQACTLTLDNDNRIRAHFEQAQRAVTPGQSIVLYDGDVCLGGAIIEYAEGEPMNLNTAQFTHTAQTVKS